MTFRKEFFLLIFLFFLQACAGGRIGNFLESSFSDLEKTNQNEDLQNNSVNKKIVVKENKEVDYKKNKQTKKVEKSKSVLENKKDSNLVKENKEIDYKKNKQIKKLEKPKNIPENKKDINLEKENKKFDDKNKKIKNLSKKRKIELQSYKIILILKDVDPKDPTEELSSILSNSEVNFEIEKIERILDSKNKIMDNN